MADLDLGAESALHNSPHGGLKITDVIHDLARWGFADIARAHPNHVKAKHTYFARCMTTGNIKIGRSRHPEGRMRQLVKEYGEPVELLATISGGDNEPMYHWWFAAHRLHGEWFAPHPEILAEIERLKEAS